MYLTKRAACVRNVAVAAVNGAITLALLLIAPLGLAAVIVNTFLITVSTFFVGLVGDWVVSWLLASSYRDRLSPDGRRRTIMPTHRVKDIESYEDY